MTKWWSKRKVKIMKQQRPSSRQDEFNKLFVLLVKSFRPFGLCPTKIIQVRGRPKFEPNRPMIAVTGLVLLSSWAALIVSFFLQYNTPLMTGIANHIQFITNVLALTVALGVPMFKCDELNAILEDFTVIDEELSFFNVKMLHSQQKNSFWRWYIVHIIFLVLSTIYDAYVMLIISNKTQLWLWFFHLLPFLLYSLAFLNAFVMIKWVKIRIEQLNSLLKQFYRYPQLIRMGKSKFKNPSIITLNVEEDRRDIYETAEELTIDNRILKIVSKTIDLATRLESYNGLLFLFSYLALFSITTIQVYYLYVTITKSEFGFSINSLCLSLIIILGNLIAIVALPYICEEVENESKRLMSYLSKPSMKHCQNVQSSIWFPTLISSIKFSAVGFFNINYSMLSGFFAGLITYLIIFIQFNSTMPSDDNSKEMVREGEQKIGM